MAGTDPRFSATKFRDAIHFVMNMGLPESTTERATFIWDIDREFSIPDSGGDPFDWSSTPNTESNYAEVQIPVAVEHRARSPLDNEIGEFNLSNLVVTLLDTEYPSIFQDNKRADKIRLDDGLYEIDFIGPPIGLFDVTVYQIYGTAVDEA